MSRRFSDEPINLIDRIPSRAQISAARPSKREWGRVLVESGAACIRGIAEAAAHVRRLWRAVHTVSNESLDSRKSWPARAQEGAARARRLAVDAKARFMTGSRTAAERAFHAYERLAEWIANLDTTMPPVAHPRSLQPGGSPETARSLTVEAKLSARNPELAELKASILAQQQELAHMSAQLQELKALVVSQQQVLVFLGKELDTTRASSETAVASAPPKRARVVRTKPTVKEKKSPQKGASRPSLNL